MTNSIQNPNQQQVEVAAKLTDRFAIASLTLGIISIFLWDFSIFPLLALIFGIIALSRIKMNRAPGHGIAVAGIILGILFILVRLSQ